MQEFNLSYRLINKQITANHNFGIFELCNMDQEVEIFKLRGTQNDFLTRSTPQGKKRQIEDATLDERLFVFFVFVPFFFWRSSTYNTPINKSGQDSRTKTISELHQFRSRLGARSYQLLYNLLLQSALLVSTTTANIMIKDDNMGRFLSSHAVLSDLFQAIA